MWRAEAMGSDGVLRWAGFPSRDPAERWAEAVIGWDEPDGDAPDVAPVAARAADRLADLLASQEAWWMDATDRAEDPRAVARCKERRDMDVLAVVRVLADSVSAGMGVRR